MDDPPDVSCRPTPSHPSDGPWNGRRGTWPAVGGVRRWRRYGHDRLYLTGPTGTALGWIDLRTGVHHDPPTSPAGTGDVERLLSHLRALDLVPVPPPVTTAGASPITEPLADAGTPTAPGSPAGPASGSPPVPWTDLARNLPGQGPAARAARLRAENRAGTLLARILGRHTDERAWRLGASGEVAVGRRLARLSRPWRDRLARRPQQWWVLHSIPVGSRGADIDHLVVGPGGVFSINTKHHPGARVWVGNHGVQVNGRPTDYVRLARHEADRASRLLSAAAGSPVRVTPVLAVVGTGVTGRRRAVGEVQVLPARSLVRALRRRPRDLGPDEVRQLYETARRSTTWSG